MLHVSYAAKPCWADWLCKCWWWGNWASLVISTTLFQNYLRDDTKPLSWPADWCSTSLCLQKNHQHWYKTVIITNYAVLFHIFELQWYQCVTPNNMRLKIWITVFALIWYIQFSDFSSDQWLDDRIVAAEKQIEVCSSEKFALLNSLNGDKIA